jgi:aminomethyltransferase
MQTPLYETHLKDGAKLINVAGWQMPQHFGALMQEHHAVREAAGLFDISHMGLIALSAATMEITRSFLEKLVPRDLSRLSPGKALYTQFLSVEGGILADAIVYQPPKLQWLPVEDFGQFLIICSPASTDPLVRWLKQQTAEALQMKILNHDYGQIALQGPLFSDVLVRLGYAVEALPPHFQMTEVLLQNSPVLISRTGYTGEDGVEIVASHQHLVTLWHLLLQSGRPCHIKAAGLEAREILRMEASYPAFGTELTLADTPLEAGLEWSLHVNKPVPFIGQHKLQHQHRYGYEKKLYGFVLNQKLIASVADIIYKNRKTVGYVTSSTLSPLLNVSIGMGYITLPLKLQPGDSIEIKHNGIMIPGEIVETPFYQKPV